MKTLLVSATEMEVKELMNNFFTQKGPCLFEGNGIALLISGIGLMETSFRLTELLSKQSFNQIINVGIAGAYHSDLKNGDLVEVISEQYGDLGAEEKDGKFLTLDDIGLPLPDAFQKGKIEVLQQFAQLKPVHAISVNTVAGTKQTIEQRKKLFNPDIETMEGLAVFRIAKELNIPANQVRSISNPITPRNRDLWDIDKAIKILNQFLIEQLW